MTAPDPTESALERLRSHLLPKTLEFAVRNTAFYAEHLGDAWREVTSPRDLPRLPILHKQTALEQQHRMRCGEAALDFGSTSSGTTRVGSELLRVERSHAELQAIEDFHRMLKEARGNDPSASREPPLVLHVFTPNHGVPAGAAPPNTMRLAWSSSSHVLEMIDTALSERHGPEPGRQIEVMRISISALKQLIVWSLREGRSATRYGLTAVGTNAALVSRRWRAIVERELGCRLFDNYSISEVTTPATECEHCGWCHFTEPPLIWELVDPMGHDVIDGPGIGHLLLTPLYPYVQRQPLIRYASGDLVERGPFCAAADDFGLRFRGRVHQSLFRARPDGRTSYSLFPAALEDIVDDSPEVSRFLHPFEKLMPMPPYQVGQPRIACALHDDGVRVRVGVCFEPALFPERRDELASAIAERLRSAHPDLDEAVAGGLGLDVELTCAWGDDEDGWLVKHLM